MSILSARQVAEQSPAMREYARDWPATVLLHQLQRWFILIMGVPPNFELKDEDDNYWPQIQKELDVYKLKLKQDREWLGLELQLHLIQSYGQAKLTLDEFFAQLSTLPYQVEKKKQKLIDVWLSKKETELDNALNAYLAAYSGLLIGRGKEIIEALTHRPLDWLQMQLRDKQQSKKKENWEDDFDIFKAKEFKEPIKP